MSSESPPAQKARRSLPAKAPAPQDPSDPRWRKLLDWSLIGAFLALAFLLGVFPMKDTDFWWHLRTGDLIRQTGRVPTTDLYTFTVPDHRWVDLHWGFQVLLSWGYAHGGVVALNLAKCVITCAALFLLVTAKGRDWPTWVAVLAWLPALLVLAGRMYVRPETVSLFYLAAYLAILFRIERRPALAFLLPVIQVAWVNTQGLFVFGPVVLTFALIAAMTRPGAFSPARRRWWRIVGLAYVLVGLACLVNPYGFTGALYPLQLAQTMRNKLFSQTIAELTPIPVFIQRSMGWTNVPLQFHVATMVLGALSFLIPMTWAVVTRLRPSGAPGDAEAVVPAAATKGKGKGKARKSAKKSKGSPEPEVAEPAWRLDLFRLALFAAFSVLSWQATRNSHQFAAVVGTVTAWNFAEWAAAIRARRAASTPASPGPAVARRLATLVVIAALFATVASGQLYAWTAEGRTIGLGEEPLWYPHEAMRFCGRLGMPERFLGFHDGYAALYEYVNGPERKVFADARLEVIGPELYERYLHLRKSISADADDRWARELDAIGRPAVLVGHADNSPVGAALMASSHWRCVWFDPIVAVFVHDAYRGVVGSHEVDFAARHFRRDPGEEPAGIPALTAMARGLWHYAQASQARGRPALARPMVLLGLDSARRILEAVPDSADGWKLVGSLEAAREPATDARVPRYRAAFDPVFDLSAVRATYALRRAHEGAPADFLTLLLLVGEYGRRGMDEAALPLIDQLVRLQPINPEQRLTQEQAEAQGAELRGRIGSPPPSSWENLSELDRIVTALLASGRAGSAADLLERAYPEDRRPWDVADRAATLRLHLGEPAHARELWEQAKAPPSPAVREARIALTYLIEGAFDLARQHYREALRADPKSFEAHYGLAVLEQDAGHAPEALAEAREAEALAAGDVAQTAAGIIISLVKPYIRND